MWANERLGVKVARINRLPVNQMRYKEAMLQAETVAITSIIMVFATTFSTAVVTDYTICRYIQHIRTTHLPLSYLPMMETVRQEFFDALQRRVLQMPRNRYPKLLLIILSIPNRLFEPINYLIEVTVTLSMFIVTLSCFRNPRSSK